MSRMRDVNVRPYRETDLKQLEQWRYSYWEGDLEIPFGYRRAAGGIETGVAEKNGEILEALVAKQAVVMDPLIVNPKADPVAVVSGLFMLERALSYSAQLGGAIESYIAVPDQLTEYHKIVEKAGYVKTVEHCTVFRRPLVQETQSLIGPARDVPLIPLVSPPPPAEEKAKEI